MSWYRELHPTKEGKRKYRFTTTKRMSFPLCGHLATHPDCIFLERGFEWATIEDGMIHIAAGYSWDGCSPKAYIGIPPIGMWVGTPDFEGTIDASLVHDVLFQFAKVGKYNFVSANYQFYVMMLRNSFKLASLYYQAVNDFGMKFWKKRKGKQTVYYL
jgi:hypothetical protein